jgi:hypothetical protein
VTYDPKQDARWIYLVSGCRKAEREMVSVMAGGPGTAEFIAGLFRREGLTNVGWRRTTGLEADQDAELQATRSTGDP